MSRDGTQPRPSIAARAERRERLIADPRRDRYAALVRALQAGRELPVEGGRRAGFVGHPMSGVVVRVAVAAVAALALAYALALGVHPLWRDAATGRAVDRESGYALGATPTPSADAPARAIVVGWAPHLTPPADAGSSHRRDPESS
jgi:hypothetical protein